ncbi:hypothetical protein [Paracoccus sp. (in: a-proteobacteria)]|uniref:hypothetical protein n=1 Tax=Paracoccus sp. TaxID=267 RepID=UPI0026E094D7|nr:hypothetical protein [Paracoccus sp. (in: a-proteobacteria)]MDO5648292.1 hypothetical protein [Paracoccus sp. (in: a-proteobacteria)]
MNTFFAAILAIVFGLTLTDATAQTTSELDADIRTARAICTVLERQGLLSQPCFFHGAKTMTMHIDMAPAEARKFCAGFPAILEQLNLGRLRGWTVNIRSPFSGNNNIAMCKL